MKSHGFLHPPPQTKSSNSGAETGGRTGGGTGAGGGADTASHTRQRDGAGRNRDPYNAPRSGCSPGEYLSQPGQRTHSPWEALLEENYSDSVPSAEQQAFVSCAQAPSNQQGEGRSSPDLLWHSLAVTYGLAA